jgi:hypothetical protein
MRDLRFNGWDDEGKVILWHCQRKSKKSFAHWLQKKLFPGETENSLKAAWQLHRVEAERLYLEWMAGGGNTGHRSNN